MDILDVPIAPQALPVLLTLVPRTQHAVRNACIAVHVAARCHVWCIQWVGVVGGRVGGEKCVRVLGTDRTLVLGQGGVLPHANSRTRIVI